MSHDTLDIFHHAEDERSKQLTTGEEPAIPEKVAGNSTSSEVDLKKTALASSETRNNIHTAELRDRQTDPPLNLNSPEIQARIFGEFSSQKSQKSSESPETQASRTERAGDTINT